MTEHTTPSDTEARDVAETDRINLKAVTRELVAISIEQRKKLVEEHFATAKALMKEAIADNC